MADELLPSSFSPRPQTNDLLADRVKNVRSLLRQAFDTAPAQTWVFLSPYRICPLGAHVDHQEGLVSGMALDHSVLFAFGRSNNGDVHVRSANFKGEVEFNVQDIPTPGAERKWGDYLRGAATALAQRYPIRHGLCGIIQGDMPIGGLSSSAAVGVAYLNALALVNGIDLSIEDSIDLDRAIEHNYIGIHNGILDQTTILASRHEHLLLLDCQSAQWSLRPAPENYPPFTIVIAYSGVVESLTSTNYNRRVSECSEAAAALLHLAERDVPAAPTLRMVDETLFDEFGEQLETNLHKRAQHYFTEQRRVHEGVKAWEQGDWTRFGSLMQESGRSSIHNYECGCPPLITLYNALNQCDGVYGARFSGAGFRGCCIGLATPEAMGEIAERVPWEYARKHPEYAEVCQVRFCHTDNGARTLCTPSS